VRGVTNLTGETGDARGQIRPPRPRTPARRPSAAPDSTARDALPARPDSLPAQPRDTTRTQPARP